MCAAIDRVITTAVETSERSRAVVGSVISMAHALNLRVVGEGDETSAQLEIMSLIFRRCSIACIIPPVEGRGGKMVRRL